MKNAKFRVGTFHLVDSRVLCVRDAVCPLYRFFCMDALCHLLLAYGVSHPLRCYTRVTNTAPTSPTSSLPDCAEAEQIITKQHQQPAPYPSHMNAFQMDIVVSRHHPRILRLLSNNAQQRLLLRSFSFSSSTFSRPIAHVMMLKSGSTYLCSWDRGLFF
jgi:hypothetical protein